MNDGAIPDDFGFLLLERGKNGNVVETTYKRFWFMVGNSCLNWSSTSPQAKDGTSYKVIRFSEWLESMRKDVECTFSILKGSLSILQHVLRLEKVLHCDQTWLTCCALCNLSLHVDGLHEN